MLMKMGDFEDLYCNHGVEGIGYGNDVMGIFNWITGTPGSVYDPNSEEHDPTKYPVGLSFQALQMVNGLSQPDLIDLLVEYGHHGNYKYEW